MKLCLYCVCKMKFRAHGKLQTFSISIGDFKYFFLNFGEVEKNLLISYWLTGTSISTSINPSMQNPSTAPCELGRTVRLLDIVDCTLLTRSDLALKAALVIMIGMGQWSILSSMGFIIRRHCKFHDELALIGCLIKDMPR